MSDFVHLHLHSEYSLLDGACRIEELLDKCVELGMPAAAITEHGNMFSSVIFHDQARKRGINPILGCEVYVAPGDRRTKSGTPGETANHLVLLAETNEGYHNLIKLVSSGCSIRGSRTSASSTSACSRSRRISGSISSSPTTFTISRTPTTSRTTSCCASARARPSTTPSA